MKILMLQDVKGTGKKGDVLNVSDGYAINFLIKKNLAKKADDIVLKEQASKSASIERTKQLEKEEALKKAENMSKQVLKIKVKLGESGKMFGAITSKEISDSFDKLGIEVDKKNIVLTSPIKALGEYIIEAKLFAGVTAKFKVVVE